MRIVRLSGWEPGLQKISLNRLLREKANHDLASAHEAVNQLLNGETVVVELRDEDTDSFMDEARNIGVRSVTSS